MSYIHFGGKFIGDVVLSRMLPDIGAYTEFLTTLLKPSCRDFGAETFHLRR